MIHIVKTNDNEYLIIEPFQINESYYSKIHYRTFSLDNARKYAIMLNEEGAIPVNAIAGGPGGTNISTVPYVMSFKATKFRKAIANAKKKRQ